MSFVRSTGRQFGLFALVGSVCACAFVSSVIPATTAASQRSLALRVERGIRACANNERAKRGLRPLRDNRTLDRAARYHARNMYGHNFFDHTDPWGRGPAERVARFDRGHTLDFIGENIAAGYGSTRAVCAGWMHSPGHRANILDRDYTVMGAGFVKGRRGYGTYFVQDFGVLKTPAPSDGGTGGDSGSGGSSGSPGAGTPATDNHHVAVRLFNVDDQETLYLNGTEVATVGYGDDETIDLGQLSKSDSITVKVDNTGGGYTWGVQETSDDAQVLDDEAGTVGQDGANSNDQATGEVHHVTFNSSGDISDTYTVGP